MCVRTHAKEYVYGWDCFMRASDKIASVTDANTYANYEKQLLSRVRRLLKHVNMIEIEMLKLPEQHTHSCTRA